MVDKTLDVQQTGFCNFYILSDGFQFILQYFKHNVAIFEVFFHQLQIRALLGNLVQRELLWQYL